MHSEPRSLLGEAGKLPKSGRRTKRMIRDCSQKLDGVGAIQILHILMHLIPFVRSRTGASSLIHHRVTSFLQCIWPIAPQAPGMGRGCVSTLLSHHQGVASSPDAEGSDNNFEFTIYDDYNSGTVGNKAKISLAVLGTFLSGPLPSSSVPLFFLATRMWSAALGNPLTNASMTTFLRSPLRT